MREQFNQLTPAEAERLAILSEECGEVIQAIGKILRHGYDSKHPDGGPTNRGQLELELGDILCIGRLMCNENDIRKSAIEDRAKTKPAKLIKFTHHQSVVWCDDKDCGERATHWNVAGAFCPDHGRIL